MTNSDSEKMGTDQNHESYSDNAKARRVIGVSSSGTVNETTLVEGNNIIGKEAIVTASQIYGRTSSGTIAPVEIDGSTRATSTISYEHHEIHAGSHFYICGFETLADSGTATFVVEAPLGKEIHMTFKIEGTNQTEVEIREDVTSSSGTVTTAMNNDRNSTNTSVGTVVYNPLISGFGTMIFSESKGLAGGTPSRASSSGIVTRNKELILKKGAKTAFIITSRAASNIVSYCGEWYENTNRQG